MVASAAPMQLIPFIFGSYCVGIYFSDKDGLPENHLVFFATDQNLNHMQRLQSSNISRIVLQRKNKNISSYIRIIHLCNCQWDQIVCVLCIAKMSKKCPKMFVKLSSKKLFFPFQNALTPFSNILHGIDARS